MGLAGATALLAGAALARVPRDPTAQHPQPCLTGPCPVDSTAAVADRQRTEYQPVRDGSVLPPIPTAAAASLGVNMPGP